MENQEKLHELEINLTRVEETSKVSNKRLEKMEGAISETNELVQINKQDINKINIVLKGIEKTVSEIQESVKSINQLAMSVHEIANEMKAMRTDVTNVTGRVKTIEDKPGKRWEGIVEKVLLVIVGGFVAFVMTNIGF